MNPAVLIASVYVFALAAFLGYQVISRVPPLLHTPLMSATNAISGISLIGSLVLAGAAHYPTFAHILGFVAVTTATINVVGGFGITDRMLKMFGKRNLPNEPSKRRPPNEPHLLLHGSHLSRRLHPLHPRAQR
jgi:NAD(P) transhydrogenase subunit alpha